MIKNKLFFYCKPTDFESIRIFIKYNFKNNNEIETIETYNCNYIMFNVFTETIIETTKLTGFTRNNNISIHITYADNESKMAGYFTMFNNSCYKGMFNEINIIEYYYHMIWSD